LLPKLLLNIQILSFSKEQQELKNEALVKLGEGFVRGLTGKPKKLEAEYTGEPDTGVYTHGHIDPVVWFHPPSLTKRAKSNEELRVPADNPGEKNDKFLDVTKRNSKDTIQQKYRMLKRSAPGGLPPQIPARTTLVEPHSATYLPTSMYSAGLSAEEKRRGAKRRNGGMFVSYSRRGVL
jgi:hypothetical protein